MKAFSQILFVSSIVDGVWGFLATKKSPKRQTESFLSMVRNIDLPECIVFYGDTVLDEDDTGLHSLFQECKDTKTAMISISDADVSQVAKFPDIIFRPPTREAPNPKDLWDAMQSIIIQPRPFGGSAGFGSKLPDPERHPMPARTVVFCETIEQTRAARFCGMRVMSFSDNDLADAIIDSFDFYLDDIATPGSFWLNPPHPRDDEGNKVYVEDLIDEFETKKRDDTGIVKDQNKSMESDEVDDDELKRILADMAPLR